MLGKKGNSQRNLNFINQGTGGANDHPKTKSKQGFNLDIPDGFSSPQKRKEFNPQTRDSPGSPTVGGILNTNGERVNNTGSTRKSLHSSFKSHRRIAQTADAYSMYDCRSINSSHFVSNKPGSPKIIGTQTRCLQDKLEAAKMEAQMLRERQKQVDSTSADSDEQDSLFDSSDDAGR